MTSQIVRMSLVLMAILLSVWFVHQQLFDVSFKAPSNLVTAAYLVNYFLGLGVYAAVLLAHRHHPMIAGYVFLGGSLFKFLVFFLFFYPIFTNDGDLSRGEFAVFFIPYITTLTTTVGASARALSRD